MLDATTLNKENFNVIPIGETTPIGIDNIKYLPGEGQIRLYLSGDLPSDNVPCRVTSEGLSDVNGNNADFDMVSYALDEYICNTDDVSVESVTYISEGGVPQYAIPTDEYFTVAIRLVNPTSHTRNVTLRISTRQNAAEGYSVLDIPLTLNAYEKYLYHSTDVYQPGQSVIVSLNK